VVDLYSSVDVLLICPTRHRSSIYHHIHSNITPSALSIDLQTFDDGEYDGTCALLRHFSPRISEDFVIVPCDFIPPSSLPLSLVLNKFRIEAQSQDHLVTTCWYTSRFPDKVSLIEEWGPPSVSLPIVYDALTETLLHIDSPDDQDKNPDDIKLRMSMLSMWEPTLFLIRPHLS
jgi:translation initiation factor eIF-2B subunit gamma